MIQATLRPSRLLVVVWVLLTIGVVRPCHENGSSPGSERLALSQNGEPYNLRGEDGAGSILRLREQIDRRLAAGSEHLFSLHLEKEEAIDLRVDQYGVDVALELIGSDGELRLSVDAPTDNWGHERLCFVAPATDTFVLRLLGLTGAGRYRATVESRRSANQDDRACRDALRAYLKGLDGTLGPQERLELLQRSASEYSLMGYRYESALAYRDAGRIQKEIGNAAGEREAYQRALDVLGEKGSLELQADLENRLGRSLNDSGQPYEAQVEWERALRLARSTKFQAGQVSALSNLAVLSRKRGEIHAAIREYEEALRVLEPTPEADTAFLLLNIGVAYTVVGRFPHALDRLTEARTRFQESGRERWAVSAEVAIGWAYLQSGDVRRAVAELEETLGLARELGDRAALAEALDRLGSAYQASDDFASAQRCYREALEHALAEGRPSDIAHTQVNLGWLLLRQGNLVAAENHLALGEHAMSELGDADGQAYALTGLARVARAHGQLSQARQHLEAALELTDKTRSFSRREGAIGEPHRLDLSRRKDYVDLLMELDTLDPKAGYASRAFLEADRLKAVTFSELLRESHEDLLESAEPTLVRELTSLQRQLDRTDQLRRLARKMDSDALARVERQLRELEVEYDQVLSEIRRSSPGFVEIREHPEVGLPELQAVLGHSTRLVSFFLGEERSFAFAVDHDLLQAFQLPARDVLESLARQTYERLRSSRRRSQIETAALVASTFADAALGSVLSEWNGDRLLIVPDGFLHYVPFAALPFPTSLARSPSEALLERFEITQIPSASVLLTLTARELDRSPDGRKRIALIADPVYTNDDPRVDWTPLTNPPAPRWPRLRHSGREARSIADLTAPDDQLLLLGVDANKKNLEDGTLDGYEILHFATHAFVDDEHPTLSGILLSTVDSRGQDVDGHLRLHEIAALNLPADLVVLSGCSTALGKRTAGDGLVGLSEGFFYAGANRLLVSLWDIADAPTADFMIHFYRLLLLENRTPADALRRTQQAFRQHERWGAPNFWSGFVLQGLP